MLVWLKFCYLMVHVDSLTLVQFLFTDRCLTLTHTHTTIFMALFPGLSGWAGARRKLLLDFMVQGKIAEADTPTIRLGTTPSGLINDPPPSSPRLYAGCPSCRNPTTLSGLWTATKYAGLHAVACFSLYASTTEMHMLLLLLFFLLWLLL